MGTSHFSHVTKATIVLAISLAFIGTCSAQYRIALTKKADSSDIEMIYRGYQITYKLNGKPITTSRIVRISPDFIMTTTDTFVLSDLDFIGYHRPLNQLMRFGAQVTYYGSFGILVLAYILYTQFPTYPQVGTAVAVTGFIPLVISRYIIKRGDYALFDLHYQWVASVIEF